MIGGSSHQILAVRRVDGLALPPFIHDPAIDVVEPLLAELTVAFVLIVSASGCVRGGWRWRRAGGLCLGIIARAYIVAPGQELPAADQELVPRLVMGGAVGEMAARPAHADVAGGEHHPDPREP